jgi:sulfoxide reductase catalytic subunit YedY
MLPFPTYEGAMLVKKAPDIKSSEISPKKLYLSRREFMARSAALAGIAFLSPNSLGGIEPQVGTKLEVSKRGEFTVAEKLTPKEEATSYTNFYEFSTGKREVKALSRNFRARPWTVAVEGLVERPKTFDIDEIIQMFPLEERVYRWRCVEAWSMVIPWVGFPLAGFIKKCEPAAKAAFVEFTTLYDPDQMPGQRAGILHWPYVEGLRMDEAMHPLTLLSVGMYDEILPNQNGAPFRLVVPWKYGFKSIKSIVRIRFVEKMPQTAWSRQSPEEYGFYANVNPDVSHPRWSQATERRIGEDGRRKTLLFNGYGDQVARLYSGMDLKKFY